jgi:hypothetical protein
MNLFLRPLEDVNDVTWSIIWCLIILLAGVSYYIYTIMSLAFKELEDGSGPEHGRVGLHDDPEHRRSEGDV